jgi:UDP-N-acetylglucosamine 4,6-dehydratase
MTAGIRSVLITGGTGSFGQAMTKRLLTDTAFIARVCIYSRGEFAQAEMAREINDPRVRYFIGDVRDQERLATACRGCDTIIHAAALKRIEVGQYNPTEMVKTNVLGAINVIEAAFKCGVQKVVALSTDKAWQPISPYGQSKALAETIFLSAYAGGPKFAVCRYGNVWKSRGSVVPHWQSLIKQGRRTVPVTDLRATRFFMSMDEAIDLVLGAVRFAKHGELCIPTLPAFDLATLASAMEATPEVIGLPAWEKLHEGLRDGNTSDIARRMTIEELRNVL